MQGLALFDLDGTLLNTLTDIGNASNYVLEARGYPIHSIEQYKQFVGNGAARLFELALPEGVEPAVRDEALREFAARYAAHREDETAPYDGVVEMLRALRGRGIAVAVLSNKPHVHVGPMMAHYFPGLIDLALGVREGGPIKPDPAGAYEILAALGVAPEQTVYIGDSGVDMNTAKNAGLYAIGVSWGFRTKSELIEQGADVIVDKVEELQKIIVDKIGTAGYTV